MKSLLNLSLSLFLLPCLPAATTFITNTSGNASALGGVGAGDDTALTLSAGDGGGTLTLQTISVYNGNSPQTLGVSADGLGIGNDRWGNGPQGWTFSFDLAVGFDGIGFNGNGGATEGVGITSSVWIGAGIDDTGQNWTFNNSTGTFSVQGGNGPLFDFSGVSVPVVPAGTPINIEHNSGNGGSNMTQFTVTAIPEPSSALLGMLGGMLLLHRRRS
jgi:hypothetical protein